MDSEATVRLTWVVCNVLLFSEYATAAGLSLYDISSRIVNGEDASKGEFPWMAMITDGFGKQYCGAALLNHRYVLTAAHCLLGDALDNPPNLLVRLGALRKDVEEEGISIHTVTRIVKHPNYVDDGVISDIALMELSDDVQFSDTVKPIYLPDASFSLVGQMATVAGWGLLKPNWKGSNILQKAQVPILSDTECKKIYERSQAISEDMICAGGNGKDSCSQDSGGPLMWKDADGVWYIIGVVSWGLNCGENPGVYSSVQYALPWILSTIN